MKDKNIIVTGASRGIGAAIATLLAEQGANLLLCRHGDLGQVSTFSPILDNASGRISWIQADVGTAEGCDRIVAAATEQFEGCIDGLVNNAGMCVEELLALTEDADVERMIAVNILSVVRLTRAVLRPMMRRRSGVIVTLSSKSAACGARGNAVYAGCKGFIDSFTKSVAQEAGPKGIRINAVAPGLIETDMTRAVRASALDILSHRIAARRPGRPAEAAALVGFVLSDAASYINGAILSVDGGYA